MKYDPYVSEIFGPSMPIDPKTFKGWLAFLRSDWHRWIDLILVPQFAFLYFWTDHSVYGSMMVALFVWSVWYSWSRAYREELWMQAKHRAFTKHYPDYGKNTDVP